MPIRHTVYPPDRLIVAVASGDMTLAEFVAFGRELEEAQLLHFRKIIDVADARPNFSEQEMLAMAQYLRDVRSDKTRGALAFVADPHRGSFAKLFSTMEAGGRPAKVFRSIHDARKWLAENPIAYD